ncbi:hypothetical protein [Modestobacter sp. SSW1-42]|uniref:hypothetical protein n=1 Tax=Modestobacter sp. SSW1-42 TaxID=596372 RepID=UPI0039886111
MVALLLLAGCDGPDGEPAPSVAALPEVPGMAAESLRHRSDVAIGDSFQVRLTNTGTTPFTVTSVQLDSPGFAGLPARERVQEFDTGRRYDLTARFGAVDCAVSPDPVAALLTVVRDGAPAERVRVPLAGPVLGDVHAELCRVEAVTDAAGVSVVGLTATGDAVTGEVVLTRGAGTEGDVVVSALQRSVVLEPVLSDGLPARMSGGELRMSVTFRPATCDPHALAETKQPFVFPLLVAVGEGAPVPVPLPLDDGQRALLQDLLSRVCQG